MLRTDLHPSLKNGLLARLPEDDISALAPLLQPATLKQREVLFEPFRPIEHLHFFETGLSSEIAGGTGSEHIEVGCTGHEGVSGVPLILGVESTPHLSVMQVGGFAYRMRSSELRRAMDMSPSLRRLLLQYAHVFMIQLAATALADGRYRIEERLARWLLMCQDRVAGSLPLTHEFLALMLGVRRPSVTDALHVLERRHLIKAERGLIVVRDRAGLVELAGGSYGLPEAEYRRIIAQDRPPAAFSSPSTPSGN